MTSVVEIDRRGDIALLLISAPPVNALSAPVRAALQEALTGLRDDASIAGVVIAGAGRGFSAGADITEFQQAGGQALWAGCDPAEITALIDDIEKPVVAALHGLALGGGLELALGCHRRIAAAGTRLGLPEIKLGVLPGAGGTQRLPRLVGVDKALEMMLSGQDIGVAEALSIGLVDRLAEGDLIADAIGYAESLAKQGEPPRRARDRIAARGDSVADTIAVARAASSKKRAQATASRGIIDCVEAAMRLPFDAGMQFEREHFLACNASPEAAALQHAFFAQREAARATDIPPDTQARRVDRIGVVGGGTMGRGIAMAFINAGLPVVLLETAEDRATASLQAIRSEYARLRGNGKLTEAVAAERSARVSATLLDTDLAACDLVIEAVFEDLAVKTAVCARLGQVCKPGAIIASNTSTLDVDALAIASGRPHDFLGMHFFSPAHLMQLLEVVRGRQTAPDVLVTVMKLARQLDKHPVISGVCYGFIGNRMLEPYLRETESLLLEGASPSTIDAALEKFGMAMGPCRMMDLAGVDVVASVVEERAKAGGLPDDPRYRIVCREMARIGRYGQKTSEGFYRYDGRKLLDDVDAVSLIAALASRQGVTRRADITEAEIVERCLMPLINEGFRIVEEGIASRHSDVDVVWLAGYGFPRERGGPIFYAQKMGTGWIAERLSYYARTRSDPAAYWAPAASLAHPAGALQ